MLALAVATAAEPANRTSAVRRRADREARGPLPGPYGVMEWTTGGCGLSWPAALPGEMFASASALVLLLKPCCWCWAAAAATACAPVLPAGASVEGHVGSMWAMDGWAVMPKCAVAAPAAADALVRMNVVVWCVPPREKAGGPALPLPG